MCGQVNKEEYEQELLNRIEILNSEKKELPTRTEIQNRENRNTKYSRTTKLMLTKVDKKVCLIKKIMTQYQNTLPYLRNHVWKNVILETENIKKNITKYPNR